MEIVSSIATKTFEYAIDAIFHQLGYLVRYKGNIKDLKKQANDLELAKSRVKALIVEAENQGESIHKHVSTYLTEVDMITEDINEKNFSNVSCFNVFQRYLSSREAKKMKKELAMFQANLDKVDKVSYRGPLPWMDSVFGYLSFESRDLIVEKIVEALEDPDINIIGVHGMGGTGKTMLVKEISCQVSNSKLFEPVIMAVVGQNPDINHIQKQLADMLRFELMEKTEQGRAVSLRNRLQKEEKILIIIDDVWKGLDLERVGIPCTNNHYRGGSKIIVTSRSHDILSNGMSIDKKFKVGDLTKDESWILFKNMVDESFESNNRRKEIAKKIANKCGNLPIALVTVAKALKKKELPIWEDALRQLMDPASVEIEGVSKEAYASLKLSYDHLKSREEQLLFLLCSMFPDDYDIDVDDLSRYATGLKFLKGVHTLGTTRNKIVTLIDHLESSCLIKKSGKKGNGHLYVKMHDVIRDVAINIASNDDQMCTLSYGKGLNRVQDENTDRHYIAIFANCVNFKNLPMELSFSKLKLLALLDNGYKNRNSLQIPGDCFERMGNLEVLHLKGMSFSPLPSSFNYLSNLRTLLLIDCHLENIDMIGTLKNLEILDFSESNITELPLSLSQLTRLKQLKVSCCRQLRVIQPEVISRMTKLEELFLDRSFDDWEVGESNNCEQKKTKASISELGCLSCLTCLYLCIPHVRSLLKIEFLNNFELKRFQIVIGKKKRNYYVPATERMLDIKSDSRNGVWINRLLKKCDVLCLEGTCGVKEVVSKLKTSVHLTYLKLKNNEDVEYLVSELDPNLPCDDAFLILETLVLTRMRSLKTIVIEGYSFKTCKVFENLKTLEICRCDKMKYLFPFSIIEGLSNLQSIEISNCEMMEAMVIENEAVAEIQFRRLKRLKLEFLPEWKSFCGKLLKAKGLIESKSSEIVEVKELEEEDQRLFANSITPFHCQITVPNLESVHIVDIKNVCHDQLFGYNFSNLSIKVSDIESVFTLKNIKELQTLSKLESLKLWNLPNLKNVWNKDIPYGILTSIQSLRQVDLKKCPQIKTLFPHSLTKHLQQLQWLSISQCGIDEIFGKEESELEYSNSKVSFPSLKSLKIMGVNNLEIIWHNQLIVDDMSNLQYIKLVNCKSLKSIFTSNVMSALKRLDVLHIHNCDSLEQVFEIHQPEQHHEVASISLRKLFLCNLPSLKHVWSNDPYGMYQFQDLNDVEVTECPKLRTLFPPSIVRDLPCQLQRLHVDDSVDVIFMRQEPSSANVTFCKDAFIGLKDMELHGKRRIRELCHPNLSRELFPALKVLKLKDFLDYELAFHQLLQSLERLEVVKASLVEIFSYDNSFTDVENQNRRYSLPLKTLYLKELPNLLHLWKESSNMMQPLFDNLEVVEVKNCCILKTLVISSSFTFKNLKQLSIYKCEGLKNLFGLAVAKTLVCLKKVKLCECNSMSTVVTKRKDEREEDEIVFSELKVLELYNLPNLQMFQGAEWKIRFPNLKTIAIKNCFKMMTFSHGIVCTPLLKFILVHSLKPSGRPKKFWAGNINDTIRMLNKEEDYGDSISHLFQEEEFPQPSARVSNRTVPSMF